MESTQTWADHLINFLQRGGGMMGACLILSLLAITYLVTRKKKH